MSKTIAILISVGMFATACAAAPQPEPQLTPASRTAKPAWSSRVTAAQLAGAYCDQARACGSIGDNRTYSSRSSCEDEWVQDGYSRLTAQPCRYGVDEGRLQACLDDIHSQTCSDPISETTPIPGCSPVDLCRSP
jgi:hypothetical protein